MGFERVAHERTARRSREEDGRGPAKLSPASEGPQDLLALQRTIGNASVVGLLAAGQAKLSVGASDDRAEVEADAVARDVVARLRAGTGLSSSGETVERRSVQRAGSIGRRAEVGLDGGPLSRETESAIDTARQGGQPLEGGVRRAMEGAFGADFGGVRLHSGEGAKELNERVQASAFTVGNDIFFRDAVPDATTTSGQALLAHELTHTIQQGASEVVGREAVDQRMDSDDTD